MKLKVLIVDDEPIICQGLRQTVPWHEIGAEIIGVAYDGEEALEFIEQTEVDLVLSDVKMPVMDGLLLAEQISNRFPDIKLLIISGYGEFEYAKRAIKYGVKDYLLKPVEIDELMRIIKEIHEEIVQERKNELRSMLRQVLNSSVMGKDMELHQLPFKDHLSSGYCLIGSEIKNYSETVLPLNETERQDRKNNWVRLLDEHLNHKEIFSASIFINENRLLTCCRFSKEEQPDFPIFEEIEKSVEKQLGNPIFLCLSSCFPSLREINSYFQELLDGLKAHPYMNRNVFTAKEFIPNTGSQKRYPDSLEKRVKRLWESGAAQQQQFAEDLFKHFAENKWSLEDVIAALKEIEKKLLNEFQIGIQYRRLHQLNVTVYNSYNQIKKLFLEDLKEFSSYRQSIVNDGQRWLVKKAIAYIHEHYSSDLKAAEIAGVINVSPNYFSQLIKQETGKHFNDYLHDVRVNQAKSLLKETPFRIFEVSEMVGYKDYKYFVQIFKRVTDLTPTQYRNIAAGSISHD